MTVLFTVLQRDLGIHCDLDWNALSDNEFFAVPERLFLYGVTTFGRGSCSSLPPAFAAVGRRLRYPLKLVRTFQHVFLRWDDPTGERFNIECTTPGFLSHPDTYYRNWPRRLTDQEIRRNCSLQSLTPRQELPLFLCNRGRVLLQHDKFQGAVIAYAHAQDLHPENWSHSACLVNAMNLWRKRLRNYLVSGFPIVTTHFPPRRFPGVPEDLEQSIRQMAAFEKILHDEEMNAKWWKPMRSNGKRPPDLPAHITVRFLEKTGEPVEFIFANKLPDWYDPKKVKSF